VKPDGTIKQIHGIGHPVLSRNGELVQVVGTMVDVTERRLAEAYLRRNESYLAQAQRLAHMGSWAWDATGRNAVYVSEEWCRIYGFDPKDGMPCWEQRLQRVHPEDRARFQLTIDRAVAEKSDYDVEFRILPPHAPGRYIHSVGHPILGSSGELVQFVGVSMDVTESKRAEQEHERLRQELANLAHLNRVSTIGELTASLAHEIKQPIGAAVTNADACVRLLDRDQSDVPEAREAALEMAKDARRAAEIIDRVRSLYQKGSSQLETIEVNEVIGGMVVMLQKEADRRSVRIRTDLAGELPKVMADRVQLQQVLMNLMINGIEAMLGTSGELTIKSKLADDGQLLISVTDTGVGLPTENADQVFNPFFTTKSQGTGLGLAITRSIVESHGGRIWATGNSGRGATFSFTLPGRVAVAA
jgi:PAS domain S-box-containing protein